MKEIRPGSWALLIAPGPPKHSQNTTCYGPTRCKKDYRPLRPEDVEFLGSALCSRWTVSRGPLELGSGTSGEQIAPSFV